MITDKPERLDVKAAQLEEEAQRTDRSELAKRYREEARQLRQESARLRKRRTDGVRFG